MNKTELRKKYKEIRKNIAKSSVTEEIYSSRLYQNAKSIFSFVSYGTEIDTIPFILRALKDGKKTAVPLILEKGEMVFVEITSLNELKSGKYGIKEPEYSSKRVLVSDEHTLIAVPGLAFDSRGCRLGYGGGYYDRYLSQNPYMAAVGFCYEGQLTDSLPRDEYDIAVDNIATERRII